MFLYVPLNANINDNLSLRCENIVHCRIGNEIPGPANSQGQGQNSTLLEVCQKEEEEDNAIFRRTFKCTFVDSSRLRMEPFEK
jgi:hypothetical protein